MVKPEGILFGKPVSTPLRVRGELFRIPLQISLGVTEALRDTGGAVMRW